MATTSGRVQFCLDRVGFNCENILIIHENHHAFNKRNAAEDHSELASGFIFFMRLKTSCTQHNVSPVSAPL